MLKDPSFIYLATILPPFLIGLVIWKSEKFPEPGKFIVASFLLGVSIYLPLDLLIMITEDHLAPLLGLDMNAYYEYINDGYKNALKYSRRNTTEKMVSMINYLNK